MNTDRKVQLPDESSREPVRRSIARPATEPQGNFDQMAGLLAVAPVAAPAAAHEAVCGEADLRSALRRLIQRRPVM